MHACCSRSNNRGAIQRESPRETAVHRRRPETLATTIIIYCNQVIFCKIPKYLELFGSIIIDSPSLSFRPMHWEMCGN